MWGLELAMKLVGSEESGEALLSTGQHMSPPSLARAKMASIVVDMGNHGEVDYSPNKKSSMRPEPVSRIHLIPLLMVFVFFILWAGSTEILPAGEDATSELFVIRMPTPNKFSTSQQLKVLNDEISHHGSSRVALEHDHVSHHKHASHGLSEKTYMRGVTT